MSKSSLSFIIPETCVAIWDALRPKFLPTPNQKTWENIAKDFFEQWQFPNCCGSMDGKHIRIQAPNNSGSSYFNYKKYSSVVLLAVADANYKFVVIKNKLGSDQVPKFGRLLVKIDSSASIP